jgi:haloalkane dehalogenase
MASEVPGWVDRHEYPFAAHYFPTDAGRIHYVDEGSGSPIVFVHGNPAWSFEFRNLIKPLSGAHRCLAPDHLGFGLSDKPLDWSYLPTAHAENLERFLESLDLHDLTIYGQDWGGPIGLSYAIRHPERVRALVVSNTWLWSVRRDWYYQAFSKFIGGPIGRSLIRRRNFFAKTVMRMAYGDRRRLTPAIHQHYLRPLEVPLERKGCWVFPKQIVGSSKWLATLWSQRERLRGRKFLFAWGMKDIAFREKELQRWCEAFPEGKAVRYPDAGHYLAEEKPQELTSEIRAMLGS